MPRTLRNAVLALAVVWSFVLLPEHALAQSVDATLTCNSNGTVAGGHLYTTQDPGNPRDVCDFTGWQHIFSYIICNFVGILDSVLSRVYCGMQYGLKTVLAAVITVYLAVFGVQILMGTTQLNAREMLTRLMKIALVWVFVTDATVGIGYAFRFFLQFTLEGVGWVMSGIPLGSMESADPNISAFCHSALADSTGGVVYAFTRLDEMMCNAVLGPMMAADNEVIAFFLAISVFMLPILGLVVYWIWMNFTIMVRGLISFLLGISAMAFLISLSPVFLSMALFKSTYQFFENWLKYMISFSLQVVIIFACIAMWITVTFYFVDFFNELSRVVFPYQKIENAGQAGQDKDSVSICPYNYSVDSFGPYVECKKSGFNPVTSEVDRKAQIRVSALLIAKDENGNAIDNTTFIYYVVYHLITLIVVAYAFDALMRDAPSIAVELSGPQYTPMLGGGFGFNRYGQIMTRAGTLGGRGGGGGREAPTFLQRLGGAASEGATTVAKNFREQMRDMVRGKR